MKKKMKIGGIIFLLIIVVGVLYVFYSKTNVYAYIGEIKEENESISLKVDMSSGHYKYAGYSLKEQKEGIYVFQLYGNLFSGKLYPITIDIDNKDKDIKKIIQKGIESDKYEVIYDSTVK